MEWETAPDSNLDSSKVQGVDSRYGDRPRSKSAMSSTVFFRNIVRFCLRSKGGRAETFQAVCTLDVEQYVVSFKRQVPRRDYCQSAVMDQIVADGKPAIPI